MARFAARAGRAALAAVVLVLAAACVVGRLPVGAPAHASGRGRSEAAAVELRWRRAVGVRPEYVVADDRGVITVTRRGGVVAFAADGQEAWRVQLPLRRNEIVFAGSASLGDGLLAVPVDEARIVAVDRASGAPRWDVAMATVRATAVGRAGDDSVLVAAMNRQGALKVLDGSTGALRWETALVDFDPEGGSLPRLSFRRGLLVVSWVSLSGSHLATFESATGAPGWVYDAPNFSTVPAVTDQSVSFAQTVTIDRHHVVSASVRSLELQTGRVLWSHDLTSRGVFFPDLAGAAGAGRVVVVDHLGAVRAFGEVSGEPLWRRTTRRPQVAVEPVIAGGVVVVPVLDSRLLGWQLDAGSAASMGALGGPQVGLTIEGAAADGSRLYVLVAGPRGDGEVWGYEAASGSGGGPPLH